MEKPEVSNKERAYQWSYVRWNEFVTDFNMESVREKRTKIGIRVWFFFKSDFARKLRAISIILHLFPFSSSILVVSVLRV